jgi:transmembrane sensor
MRLLEEFQSIPPDVAGQATYWFARSRSGDMNADDVAALERWLGQDAEHAEAFGDVGRLWSGLERVRRDLQHRRRFVHYRRAAAACAVLIMAGSLTLFLFEGRGPSSGAPTVYATGVGEMSNLGLPDGSVAVLDTDSALRVWPAGGAERRLELVRGRAFFKVAKDPAHPFVVLAGGHSVTALGTEFDVYLKPAAIEVTLVEGRLRVRSDAAGVKTRKNGQAFLDMRAGYHLVASSGRLDLTKADATSEAEWRDGRLVFDEQRLEDIAAELNRYTPDKVVISEPEVGRRRMSAVFKSADTEAFVAAVQTMGLARVRHRQDGGYDLTAPPKNSSKLD